MEIDTKDLTPFWQHSKTEKRKKKNPTYHLKSLIHAEHRLIRLLLESDFKIYGNSESFVSDSHITRKELIYQSHCLFLFFPSSICRSYSFSFYISTFFLAFFLFFLLMPKKAYLIKPPLLHLTSSNSIIKGFSFIEISVPVTAGNNGFCNIW